MAKKVSSLFKQIIVKFSSPDRTHRLKIRMSVEAVEEAGFVVGGYVAYDFHSPADHQQPRKVVLSKRDKPGSGHSRIVLEKGGRTVRIDLHKIGPATQHDSEDVLMTIIRPGYVTVEVPTWLRPLAGGPYKPLKGAA